MEIPDDQTLTREGMSSALATPLLVIACGALAREIKTIIEANGIDHVALTCLPAILHNHPEQIVPAVERAVEEAKPRFKRIFIAYADCGTGGGLERAAERLGVEMLPGPHCYSFYEGVKAFAERSEDEFRAFYLTDFLARQFDAFVWEPLGLDRHPELLGEYFGHYEKVVFLSQTHDPSLLKAARSAAERLELAFEHRHTGFGDLATKVRRFAELPDLRKS